MVIRNSLFFDGLCCLVEEDFASLVIQAGERVSYAVCDDLLSQINDLIAL